MSGTTNRRGLRFQDAIVAERILRRRLEQRQSTVGERPRPPDLEFGIEHGVQGEEWDLTTTTVGEGSTVLEEAKSGAMSAVQREGFWMRVRRTLVPSPRSKFLVRLSINRQSPPECVEGWRGLAKEALSAPVGRTGRGGVRNARDLAGEALEVLTRSDPTAPPLEEAHARGVLGAFQLQEDWDPESLEAAIQTLLTALTGDVAVEQLMLALRGFLDERAASGEPDKKHFSDNEVWDQISVLKALSEIDGQQVEAFRRLRSARNASLEGTPGAAPAGGLEHQDCRQVQPQAWQEFAGATLPVALVGNGGLGKSTLLQDLYREAKEQGREVWLLRAPLLHGLSSSELEAGLRLAQSLSPSRTLAVFVDAVEGVGDTKEVREAVRALSRVAGSGAKVVLSCRIQAWERIAEEDCGQAGWATVALREWGPQVVERLVQERLTPSLQNLLRTPLFLDLFLRIRQGGAEDWQSIETRHALLQSYWVKRILPRGRETTRVREQLVMRQAEAEALGAAPPDGGALDELVSEGLLMRSPTGCRFRHSLLRDFAVSRWALSGPTAEAVGERLRRIPNSLVRWGALRAVIEATLEQAQVGPGAGLDQAKGALEILRQPGLAHLLVEVLAELERPDLLPAGHFDLVFGSDSELASNFLATVGGRGNLAWVQALARMPRNPEWVGRKPWFDGRVLRLLAAVLQAFDARAAALDDGDRKRLLEFSDRLREWAQAPKMEEARRQQPHLDFLLVKSISAWGSPKPTLDWLSGLPPSNRQARDGIMQVLPLLVARARSTGVPVDEVQISRLYAVGVGMKWSGAQLTPLEPGGKVDRNDYGALKGALLGGEPGGRVPGLLDSLPEAVLPALFEFWRQWASDFQAVRRAEAQLRFANWATEGRGPLLPLEETLEELVEDYFVHNLHGGPALDLAEEVLVDLRRRLESSASSDGTFIRLSYGPATLRSRSVLARVLLLEVLMARPGCAPDLVDDLLADGRLYHGLLAQSLLRRAIGVRWSGLSAPFREKVLSNIERVGRSPFFGDTLPRDALLEAVPEAERPVRLHRLPTPPPGRENDEKPREVPLQQLDSPSSVNADLGLYLQGSEEVPDGVRLPLARLCAGLKWWRKGGPRAAEEASEELTLLLDERWEGLPAAGVAWAAYRVREFLDDLAMGSTLSPLERAAHASAEWALKLAQRLDLKDALQPIGAAPGTEGQDVGGHRFVRDAWGHLIRLSISALGHLAPASNAGIARQLSVELQRAGSPGWLEVGLLLLEASERVPMLERETGYLDYQRQVLEAYGHDEPLTEAILTGRHRLDIAERSHLAQVFLERAEQLPSTRVSELIRRVGWYFGASALPRVGEPLSEAYLYVSQLCRIRPSQGVLAVRENWLLWLESVAKGTRSELRQAFGSMDLADYSELLRQLWNAYRSELNGPMSNSHGDPLQLAAVFYEANEGRGGIDLPEAWAVLGPIIEDFVAHAPAREIGWVFYVFRPGPVVEKVGARSFRGLLEVLARRAKSLPSGWQQGNDYRSWQSALMGAVPLMARVAAEEAGSARTAEFVDALLQWKAWEIPGTQEALQQLLDQVR